MLCPCLPVVLLNYYPATWTSDRDYRWVCQHRLHRYSPMLSQPYECQAAIARVYTCRQEMHTKLLHEIGNPEKQYRMNKGKKTIIFPKKAFEN